MDPIDESAIRRLLDRQEIWDALLSYTRGMDRLDRNLVINAYHADAIDDHGVVIGSREDIADAGMAMHAAENRKTHHCLTNHYCELDGDTAHTETYFVYFGAQEEGPTDVLGGRYLDDLERRNGEWRISNRLCFIEWSSSLPQGAATGTSASLGALESIMDARSQRSREDASYLRPLPVSTAPKGA